MSDASSSPSSIPANEEPSVVFIGIHKPSEKALKRSKPTSINDFFKKKRGRKRQYFNKKSTEKTSSTGIAHRDRAKDARIRPTLP